MPSFIVSPIQVEKKQGRQFEPSPKELFSRIREAGHRSFIIFDTEEKALAAAAQKYKSDTKTESASVNRFFPVIKIKPKCINTPIKKINLEDFSFEAALFQLNYMGRTGIQSPHNRHMPCTYTTTNRLYTSARYSPSQHVRSSPTATETQQAIEQPISQSPVQLVLPTNNITETVTTTDDTENDRESFATVVKLDLDNDEESKSDRESDKTTSVAFIQAPAIPKQVVVGGEPLPNTEAGRPAMQQRRIPSPDAAPPATETKQQTEQPPISLRSRIFNGGWGNANRLSHVALIIGGAGAFYYFGGVPYVTALIAKAGFTLSAQALWGVGMGSPILAGLLISGPVVTVVKKAVVSFTGQTTTPGNGAMPSLGGLDDLPKEPAENRFNPAQPQSSFSPQFNLITKKQPSPMSTVGNPAEFENIMNSKPTIKLY